MDAGERKRREQDIKNALTAGEADDLLVRLWNEIKAQARAEKGISVFFPDEQSPFSGDRYKLRFQSADRHRALTKAKEIQLHKYVMGINITGSFNESFELNLDDERPLNHNGAAVTLSEAAKWVVEQLVRLANEAAKS